MTSLSEFASKDIVVASATTTTTTTPVCISATTTGPFNATRNPQPPLQQPSYSFLDVPNATKDLQYSSILKISNTNRHIFQQSMAEMLLLCKEAVRRRNNKSNTRKRKRPIIDDSTANDDEDDKMDSKRAQDADRQHQKQREEEEGDGYNCKRQRCSPRRAKGRTTARSKDSDKHKEEEKCNRNSSITMSKTASDVAGETGDGNGPAAGGGGGGTKPLSLEYIADRLDIDDPCFGYMIRTHTCPPDMKNMKQKETTTTQSCWKEGMLQGFITATTFTNWQKSFRWDSLNEAAYYYDDEEEEESAANDNKKVSTEQRIRDVDGSLARELQSTVHGGNIHGEGIVWPRIAEISLLGGLGTGTTLIKCLIEDLETNLKPTIMANYDYVVLQATDNSIPFYEAMGFVRVGAIMLEEDLNDNDNNNNDNTDDENVGKSPSSPTQLSNVNNNDMDDTNVTSPMFTYDVTSTGFTFTKLATKFHVDVYDLLFSNRHILGMNVRPCDKPKIHTKLLIPKNKLNCDGTDIESTEEVPSYVSSSEVKWHICKENDTPRTIAKMYNVSTHDIVERNKIRLPGLISSSRLKESTRVKVSHLHVPDNLYKPYAHWSFPDSKYEDPEPSYMMVRKLNRRRRGGQQHSFNKVSTTESFFSSLKGVMMENENVPKPSLLLSPPPLKMTTSESFTDMDPLIKSSLYNKVVRLKPGAMTEGSDYTYWYVLTYIPDLEWCHLAPMIQDGTFGADKPKAYGKVKWRLLDESYGHEVDISSKYCIPIKSRSMKKTLDADKEEWDIIDDGSDPTITTNSYHRSTLSTSNSQRGTIAIKPSTERVRKMPPLSTTSSKDCTLIMESPSLLATIPGSGRITLVRIKGRSLFKLSPTPSPVTATTDTPLDVSGSDSPVGKKKRRMMSTVAHLPASARKAAALRATNNFAVNCETTLPKQNVGKTRSDEKVMKKLSTAARSSARMIDSTTTQQRTNPARRASLSSSTYTLDDTSTSTAGSSYRSKDDDDEDDDVNTDSNTLSDYERDDSESAYERKRPIKSKIIKNRRRAAVSTTSPSRRSSRLLSPSDNATKAASITLARSSTRSSSKNSKLTNVKESVQLENLTKTPPTPPLRLPKLPVMVNDDNKESMLSLRSIDLTPSVAYNERDERLSRRRMKLGASLSVNSPKHQPKLQATVDNRKELKASNARTVDGTAPNPTNDRNERLSRRISHQLSQQNLTAWVVHDNNQKRKGRDSLNYDV